MSNNTSSSCHQGTLNTTADDLNLIQYNKIKGQMKSTPVMYEPSAAQI